MFNKVFDSFLIFKSNYGYIIDCVSTMSFKIETIRL